METKLFEIRDKATFIPALAIQLNSETEQERYLLARAGFGRFRTEHQGYILLTGLEDTRISYDPFFWTSRTYQVAHRYIQSNWSTLKSGDVIDVEFILKETETKKNSESVSEPLY